MNKPPLPEPATGRIETADAADLTVTVILESVDRHGHSKASLPDGALLVKSSRQPFLEAARVLMAAGHSPDSWLEGWRPGSSTWALRARLGIAAGLTVDESKTVFAKWKPFSRSAVSSPIRSIEDPAPTAAPSVALERIETPDQHGPQDRRRRTHRRIQARGADRMIAHPTPAARPERERLPNRRAAISTSFERDGARFALTAGFYPNGKLGELFLSADRANSRLDFLMSDAAILLSLAIQHGADPAEIRHALKRTTQGTAASPIGEALDLAIGLLEEPGT